MNWKVGKYVVLIVVVALVVVLLLGFRNPAGPVRGDDLGKLAPIKSGAATMTLRQVDDLLHEKFDLVSTTNRIPESVKTSFCSVVHCNFEGKRFDMVDPNEEMTTDLIIPGVPNKRLRFAALNNHAAVIAYELGGYASYHCVVIVDLRNSSSWSAVLSKYDISTVDRLRVAIAAREFSRPPMDW